jgi:CheY-like chemotaxis protein
MGRTKILVVDDDVHVVRALKLNLERAMSCEVIPCSEGNEALHLARTERPDIILLDVMMPGMSGGEVAEALQERLSTCNIPVVFLTGLLDKQEAAARGGEINGKRYVAKPSSVGELIQTITEVLLPKQRAWLGLSP